MIWSGTGDVLDPTSRWTVNNEIVTLIIPDLEKERIVPPTGKK